VPKLSDALKEVAEAEEACNDANIDENDYTVFACEDLRFEFELVVQNISKKISFLDNQVRTFSSHLSPGRVGLTWFTDCIPQYDKPYAGAD
jgi:hypothetical protein